MQSSVNTLGISALYLLFLWVGPRYMRGWDAFHLRETLIVYNFSMVLLNFYICKEVCYGLAAFISRVQELLWWKENLTIVQMWTLSGYTITFITLFANFYYLTLERNHSSCGNLCFGL